MVINMKTTILIPDSLFEEVRKLAHQELIAMKVIVEECLRQIVSERKRRSGFKLRKDDTSVHITESGKDMGLT
jgi:hypothetical protein